jgi:hypothetical protein
MPQVAYLSMENHGGIISTEEFLIRPPELSGNPTSSNLVAKKKELAKEMINLSFEVSLFILRKDL